jgi:hypothetical protein
MCPLVFQKCHALFVAPGSPNEKGRHVLVLEKIPKNNCNASTSTNPTIEAVFLMWKMVSVAKA